MGNEQLTPSPAVRTLRATHVYVMAAVCLVVGLGTGYILRRPPQPAILPSGHPAVGGMKGAGHPPSLEQLTQMADKQAAPLLEKLKNNPNDKALLVQVGAIYHTSHRFKEAASYYAQALKADPGNVAVRTKLASSLYRAGDADGAIAELKRALSYDPKDANALFDLGMIKLQSKGDGNGAIEDWQRLLKSNPQLEPERKATVLKLMAGVLTTQGDGHSGGKAGAHGQHP